MRNVRALVVAGLCAAIFAGTGCNRTLPSMEPYDDYKTRLKKPGDISQSSLPVLKPKDGSQTANTGGQK